MFYILSQNFVISFNIYTNFLHISLSKTKKHLKNKTQGAIMFLIYTTFICFKQSYNVGRYSTCSALESTASSERLSRF